MQLSDLNSKPDCGKSLSNLIDRAIGFRFYPPTGLEHYKIVCLNNFHLSTHINGNHKKNDDMKTASFV